MVSPRLSNLVWAMGGMRSVLANLCWLLSPTRKFVDRWKDGTPEHRALALGCFSRMCLTFEIVWCAVLLLASSLSFADAFFFKWLSLAYGWSRCNEISWAFYRDALSRLKKEAPSSELTRQDRIVMAMRSYAGLTINFAMLFFYLPVDEPFGEKGIPHFFDALYFSAVTITTTGYGDILPTHWTSRLFAMYEMLLGVLLVVVAIGTYLGIDTSAKGSVGEGAGDRT